MSANKKIMEALKPFGYPCVTDLYNGKENHYFILQTASELGADFGDGTPSYRVIFLQIHYFLPLTENYIKDKNKIREALFQSGFTYPKTTMLTEPENNIRHIVFECEIEEEREE